MPNNEAGKGLIKSSKKWFLYWILSILFFFFIIRILNNNSNSSGLLVLLLLGDVGFGGISFLILLIRVFREKYWELLVISGFVFALFFVILVSGVLTGNNINNDVTDKLIACNVGSQCGGGSRQMKESECVNSTCCQVGNVWVVMNIDECKLKQQDYATSQRPTTTTVKQPIQVQPIKPIEPPNLCCKESCNSFTGVCTTSCTKQWVCF